VRPGDRWRPPAVADSASAEAAGPSALAAVVGEAAAWGVAATSPLAPALLRLQRPGAAALRAAALRVAPRRRTVPHQLRRYLEGLGATFDGRLRITAVDRRSGKRVVFGSPGAPPATVAEAALASCAIPWVFAPVRIGDREYVDGGAWSPSNADVSPAGRGAEVLCLLPVLSMGLGERRAVFRAVRSATRALAFAEAQALRARGARVQIVAPDLEAAQAMGSNYMDAGRRKAVLNAGWAQGRALASG
jgi:NTE family protein